MIKTRLILVLATINGIIFVTDRAFADLKTTPTSNIDIDRLSHSISTLIDLEGDTRSMVELAISRALVAQNRGLSDFSPTVNNTPAPIVTKDKNGNPIVERRRYVIGARGDLLPQQNSDRNS